MREIKFRAWDGINIFDSEYIKNINFYLKRADILMGDKFKKQFNLLFSQYTGLKDKNGVEIYEGDVIEISKKLHGKILFDDEISAFILRFINYKHSYKTLGNWINCYTIIGNIYENPELLEE